MVSESVHTMSHYSSPKRVSIISLIYDPKRLKSIEIPRIEHYSGRSMIDFVDVNSSMSHYLEGGFGEKITHQLIKIGLSNI